MRPWQSLRRKLPLLISTLLGSVVIAVCWSAYHQVEGVLVEATGARLTHVTQQLAALLEESVRRVRRDARDVAADSAFIPALTRPSPATRLAAYRALERRLAAASPPAGQPSAQAASYALWTRDGERVVAIGPLVPAGDEFPHQTADTARRGHAPLAAGVGPLVRVGDGAMFAVATPVLGAANDTIGILVAYRRVAGQSAGQIARLIGARATLLVGNAAGDVWTDFSKPVAGPPRSFPIATPGAYLDAAGQWQFGVTMRIRATPWLVAVHLPQDAALAPARQFVLKIAGVALCFVVLGAVGASLLSGRITAPLAEVTRAAEDVARGDYTRRVAIPRSDELGSLATSFNSMAVQVEAATRDLHGYAGELEAANAELRGSEERYRRLVETAHEGICAVDAAGTITYANARLAEMLGYEPQALSGRALFDFMDAEAAVEARTRFARRQRGIAETCETPFRRRDGTRLWANTSVSSWFDGTGAFAGALFMLSDSTEQHEAQARLARSERHFRALIEHASDMIAVLDASGTVRYVSPALDRFVGETEDGIVGAPAVARIHADDLARVNAALATVVAEPTRPVHVTYRYQHGDGSWRHLSSVATNLLDDPAVEGIVVNSRDVTEQRALEAQLIQAQKMEAVGQLAGGVAHDFNNLLTVMTSYCGMLLTDLPENEPSRADVEEISRAAHRAAGLTRQLLAFSRQQVLEPEVLDLNVVVRTMEKMLHRVLREDVRLETALAPSLGHVYADAGQLEQVIVNLAVNACDAMLSGGALTIGTADVELDAAYCRSRADVRPGAYVLLSVSDSGTGMDAATQARIFDPFFTTKAVGKGTGLGLSTVYGIIKQSGGHVAVYSELGVGTTMKIYLPRHHTSAQDGDAAKGRADGLRPGAGTVLLVEDEAPVRAAAHRILERAGYTVLAAASGAAALACCARHVAEGGSIDLLLTDMVMPEMSGRELAARLHALQPDAGTAFMSGYTEDAVLRQGGVQRDAVFIQKPFTPETLTQKLREAFEAKTTQRAA